MAIQTPWTAVQARGLAGPAGPAGPPGPVDTTLAAQVNARVPSGTGSPEGVVTASPGALYQQTDGTQVGSGTTVSWVKETGTGNTGWRKLRTVIPLYIDLFGARGGDGKALPVGQAAYAFLTAVTASTKPMAALLTGRVIEAIPEIVWTPNNANNGIKVQTFDSVTGGVPDNPTDLFEATGLANATPIASSGFANAPIQANFDGNTQRYVGFQFKTDAAVAPVLFAVRILVHLEV